MKDAISILSNLAVIGSMIFVGYQFLVLKKDYRVRNEREEKNKAVELSKFYAEEILKTKIPYIKNVYSESGIIKEMKGLHHTQLRKFDIYEMKELFSQESIERINYIEKNIDPKILSNVHNLVYCETEKNLRFLKIAAAYEFLKKEYGEDLKGIKEEKDVKKLNKAMTLLAKYLQDKNDYTIQFNHVVSEALNLLEYFSMNFNCGLADEKVVYQSLHQSFLHVITTLYIVIAERNIDGNEKYYTNIIQLFTKWSNRASEHCAEDVENRRVCKMENRPIKK